MKVGLYETKEELAALKVRLLRDGLELDWFMTYSDFLDAPRDINEIFVISSRYLLSESVGELISVIDKVVWSSKRQITFIEEGITLKSEDWFSSATGASKLAGLLGSEVKVVKKRKKREQGSKLDDYREVILGWLSEGMPKPEMMKRLESEHGVTVVRSGLYSWIKKNS